MVEQDNTRVGGRAKAEGLEGSPRAPPDHHRRVVGRRTITAARRRLCPAARSMACAGLPAAPPQPTELGSFRPPPLPSEAERASEPSHQMRESFSMGGVPAPPAEASSAAASAAWRNWSSSACLAVTCRREGRWRGGRQAAALNDRGASARKQLRRFYPACGCRRGPASHLPPQARLLCLVSRQVGLRPRAGVAHLHGRSRGGTGGRRAATVLFRMHRAGGRRPYRASTKPPSLYASPATSNSPTRPAISPLSPAPASAQPPARSCGPPPFAPYRSSAGRHEREKPNTRSAGCPGQACAPRAARRHSANSSQKTAAAASKQPAGSPCRQTARSGRCQPCGRSAVVGPVKRR